MSEGDWSSDFKKAPEASSSQPNSTAADDWSKNFSVAPSNTSGDGSQSWAQYAGDPSHSMPQRIGAAMVEEGRRAVSPVYNAITDLPGLAHRAGAETAANTATPETAGQVANLASMTTPGDMMAPGLSGALSKAIVPKPSPSELYTAGDAGYTALRNLGVHYDLGAGTDMANQTAFGLAKDGFTAGQYGTAPKTHNILNSLSNPGEEAVSLPLAGLADARKSLGKVTQGNDRTDALAARKAISSIDDFIKDPPPQAVLAGDATSASDILNNANGNWAAAKRDDKINAAGDYARFKAAGANSGANYDNNLRQRLRPLFDPSKPQRLSGYTDEEKQGIQNVINGTAPRNTLRTVSGLMGGGGGPVAGLEGIGAAYAGYEHAGIPGALAGIAIPAVGRGLRGVQNNMAEKALNNASETVRARSPLYQQRVAAAPFEMQANAPGIAAMRAAGTYNPQDSQGYASGGAVKKPTHEQLLTRFMTMVEKAKKTEKERTKPLLSVPDDVIANALAAAHSTF